MKDVGGINKTFNGCLVDALAGSAEVLFGARCGDGSVSSSAQACQVVTEPMLRVWSANKRQLDQYAATMCGILQAGDRCRLRRSAAPSWPSRCCALSLLVVRWPGVGEVVASCSLRAGATRQLYGNGEVLSVSRTPAFLGTRGRGAPYALNKDKWYPITHSALAAAKRRIGEHLAANPHLLDVSLPQDAQLLEL